MAPPVPMLSSRADRSSGSEVEYSEGMRRSLPCRVAWVPRTGGPSGGGKVHPPVRTVRVVFCAPVRCAPGASSGLAFVILAPTLRALGRMRGKRVAALSHME
ncbi:hypothetical protein GCM10010446_64830 [Streptomyces enissocaesilis]|uniref:Uncharacterized protein n=1 Tax=Streptomyces enissocaesilis TaxID=332589 RepID=A0ABP6K4G4_9ACTN